MVKAIKFIFNIGNQIMVSFSSSLMLIIYVFIPFKLNNNNKQVSIVLRQIITSKMWLHQSSSKYKSVNKINAGLGLVDTNKDKKHAKHQSSKCENIYKRKKTKHKKANIHKLKLQ